MSNNHIDPIFKTILDSHFPQASLIDSTSSEAIRIWEEEKVKEAQNSLPQLVNSPRPAPSRPEYPTEAPKRGHTILIHVWIHSPEDAGEDMITAGKLEREIQSAIMRSNRIIDAIEIDKIEVEADLNYTEAV